MRFKPIPLVAVNCELPFYQPLNLSGSRVVLFSFRVHRLVPYSVAVDG
jgi:hypothetical protein